MLKYITKENITLVLAIIGSVGTAISCINRFLQSRIKLSLILYGFRKTDKGLLMYVGISNKSQMPISITSISLKIDEDSFNCKEIPERVVENIYRSNGVEYGRDDKYSMLMPISLSSLFSACGYVYFELPPQVLKSVSTQATFLIHTNRNKIVQRTILLNKPLH